jgi:hypothetical protein
MTCRNDIVSVSGHLWRAREDLRRWLLAWVPELVQRGGLEAALS